MTARRALGERPWHRTGSAMHRGTRGAGSGARRAGARLTAPTSSLGIIREGSRISETLDRLLLPTHSRFELRPCFGWRRARLRHRAG